MNVIKDLYNYRELLKTNIQKMLAENTNTLFRSFVVFHKSFATNCSICIGIPSNTKKQYRKLCSLSMLWINTLAILL